MRVTDAASGGGVPIAVGRPTMRALIDWSLSWRRRVLPVTPYRAGISIMESAADQLLDRRDRLGVVGAGDDGDGHAGASGAAGAADAVHIIVGMDRHVEIVDVADVGDIEAARRHVGGDQQASLRPCEIVRVPRCAPD